jgi:hypothetical protein
MLEIRKNLLSPRPVLEPFQGNPSLGNGRMVISHFVWTLLQGVARPPMVTLFQGEPGGGVAFASR